MDEGDENVLQESYEMIASEATAGGKECQYLYEDGGFCSNLLTPYSSGSPQIIADYDECVDIT